METTSIIRIFCLIGALFGFLGLYMMLSIYEITGFTVAMGLPLILTFLSSLYLIYKAFKPSQKKA